MQKIIEFLKYPSTWQGVITLAGMLGVQILPEQQEAIITAGISLVALIAVFFSDADVKPKK